MIGKTISHYKVLEKLGEGGMGVVYKAEDTKLKRIVALKFLPKQTLGDEEEIARFVHEAQAAAALDHPNICTVHEIDEAAGQTFISMAYIDGQSLKEKIESGPIKLEEALDICIQVAEGLQEAHEKGIVHRDIKSANVMLTSKGQAKIMDFGLAKLSGRTKLTKTGMTMGTVSYMSPEQARGEAVDHRSDIWALGIVLFEMLTGQIPFKGDYEQALMYSIMHEDPEPLTGLRTGMSIELEQIVNKCLEKEPANRYQHVDELIVDLRRIKKEQALKKTHTQMARSTKIQKKRTVSLVLPGIVLGALILVVAGYFFFAPGKRKTSAERKMLVVLPFENLGSTEAQYFADGVTEEITSRLALVSGLGVISRTSAYQYAKTDKTIKQIGEELGVDFVLEGTVRWAQSRGGSDRVRITPQLIRTGDDTHLWANTYDRIIDDIFEIQTEIAQKVVEQLGITLLEPEHRAVEVRPTENLEAYQAYLRGRYFEGRPHFSLENWKRVVQNYQSAVELDSSFALAWAELSKAHSRFYFFQYDLSDTRLKKAEDAAERALELAPESPKVHLVLSYHYLWAFRNPERSLAELEIAEKGLPNNTEILQAKAAIYELQGRWEEALNHLESAYELSPRDASLPTDIAWVFWTTRRYRQAIDACNQAIALAPDAAWPYLYKAFTYWFWKGATDEARAALEEVPKNHGWAPWAWFWQEIFEGRYRKAIERLSKTSGEWIRLKMWARPKSLLSAFTYELQNEPLLARAAYDSASKLLETEVQTWPNDPRYHSSLGIAYAALGRKDAAIQEGERAVELLPVSRDAFYGLSYVQDLAFIYTLVGEYDAALGQIEYLLSIPSWFSVSWLKLDPRWNRLREHSGFKRLLEKYSGESL